MCAVGPARTTRYALDAIPDGVTLRSVTAEPSDAAGRPSLRIALTEAVRRDGKPGVDFIDQPTFVILPLDVSGGRVAVDISSRPAAGRARTGSRLRRPGVRDRARRSTFEAVYVRPYNGKAVAPDELRRSRARPVLRVPSLALRPAPRGAPRRGLRVRRRHRSQHLAAPGRRVRRHASARRGRRHRSGRPGTRRDRVRRCDRALRRHRHRRPLRRPRRRAAVIARQRNESGSLRSNQAEPVASRRAGPSESGQAQRPLRYSWPNAQRPRRLGLRGRGRTAGCYSESGVSGDSGSGVTADSGAVAGSPSTTSPSTTSPSTISSSPLSG